MGIPRSGTWRSSWAWCWCTTAILIAWSPPAEAQVDQRSAIDVESASLPEAIAELARETGVSIGTEGTLPRLRSHPVKGRMSVDRALSHMLAGTGYVARRVGATAWRIERTPQRQAAVGGRPKEIPPTIGAEILVTGTKRELSLDNAAIAVAVVRPDAIQQVRVTSDSAFVAVNVEGFSLTGQGPGRNRMFLRGVADSAFGGRTQSTVAVLLDDARITYAAPDPDIRLVDVERVELLKGPQGSLYGTGALGGIYRVVTRRADLSNMEFAIGLTAETVEHGSSGASGAVVANLPLARDKVGLRLVAYGELAPGWVDTGTKKDSNTSGLSGVRAGLGVDLGDGWRADATGFGQWLGVDDSRYVYESLARRRPAQLAEKHDNDLLHGSLRVARDEGPIRIVMSSGYTSHVVDEQIDATQGAELLGMTDPERLLDANRYKVWDNEIRANGQIGRLGWLGGISYLSARQDSSRDLTGLAGSTMNVDSDDRSAEELALFGELSLPLTGRIEATAGARVFRSLIEERRAEGAEAAELRFIRYGVTPDFGLSWKPKVGRLIYLHYGSAFRQGGTGIGEDGTIEALEGDELATLSAGWRDTLGMIRFDLGLYHSWWSEIQSDVLRPNGLIETANVGDGEITGAELSVEAEPAERWRLQGGAMLQSAKIDPVNASSDGDRRLPVVPDMTFRAAVLHDFYLGDWDMSARAQLNYFGSARLSFDPALDRKMGKVFDATAELRASRGPFGLSLEVLNLLAGRHDTFAYGNPLRVRTAPQFTPQQPRTFRLTLSYRPGGSAD
ncbi:TonB-dependent receptor [Altererythrobacter salegens]|uniref:TonB-dependent receptor n=1 Tax=Croceibacterium salegens TaxID=1737568 RepID=A0A6I4SRA3_9SPHN|nr:TonB-dependent receptor [Croceibacterium salegens]MXO58393.1 TonB-dependent receptor [Croceibacterium salegens]